MWASPGRMVARSITRMPSATALTFAGWAAGALVTCLIIGTPYLSFGIRSSSGHLVLDSVDACVALLVAYLVYGRFTRGHRMQDLLLTQGLVLLAVAGLLLTYASGFLTGFRPAALDVWLPLAVRVLGAFTIAAAAMAGQDRTVGVRWRSWPGLVPVPAATLACLLLWSLRSQLPVALDPKDFPTSAEHPAFAGHPVLIFAQAASALFFVLASASFAGQAVRSNDPLLTWLGPGCALAAFARVNYALYPSLYTDWLYTGDLLRTGCYVLLLVGAAREIRQYWRSQALVAVLEDRRRLARELHDGVVQELAFIRSESYDIPTGAGRRDRIISACDRALDETRAAIHALGNDRDEPLMLALQRAANQVAQRHGIQVASRIDDTVIADDDQRHALVRITREAVSNAARHGAASRVYLRLERSAGLRRLSIHDDGRGFDVDAAAVRGSGYGLISMRDRARALPGSLVITSDPGEGTMLTVTW